MYESKPDIDNAGAKLNKGNKPHFSNFKKHGNTHIKFEGCIPSLTGHVYDYSGPSQSNQYTTVKRKLAGCVATTFKNRNDVKMVIEKMSVPTIKLLADLPTTATQAEKRRWEKKFEEGTKRERPLEDIMKTLYSLLWRRT